MVKILKNLNPTDGVTSCDEVSRFIELGKVVTSQNFQPIKIFQKKPFTNKSF